MAIVRAEHTEFDRNLSVVLDEHGRAEGNVLDVVLAKLDLHEESMEHIITLWLETIDDLTLSHNRNAVNTIKSASLQLDTHDTAVALGSQGLTNCRRVLKAPWILLSITQLSRRALLSRTDISPHSQIETSVVANSVWGISASGFGKDVLVGIEELE
jgi:hypothetical protein